MNYAKGTIEEAKWTCFYGDAPCPPGHAYCLAPRRCAEVAAVQTKIPLPIDRQCSYCGDERQPDSNYCSEICMNHYREEAWISSVGASRNAIFPPAQPAPYSAAPVDDGYVLPTDSEARKEIPIFSGVLNYFPLAIAAVARLSKSGNDKHNPGQPLHWARRKSTDHADCIARHLLDIETQNAQGEYEDAVAIAWRALAYLQEVEEKRLHKTMSRGSKDV